MLYPLSILSLILLFLIHVTSASPEVENDTIPFSTRAHWMRKANSALAELNSPCPFGAFGTVIVNHTAPISEYPLEKLICNSVSQNAKTGNPTLHGEISGINNCISTLTSPTGPYKLTPAEALRGENRYRSSTEDKVMNQRKEISIGAIVLC